MTVAPEPADLVASLTALRKQVAAAPYVLGGNDCFLATLAVVDLQQGSDLAGRIRGSYSTEAGILRALKRAGFASVDEALAAHFRPIAVASASLGAIGVARLDHDQRDHACWCVGSSWETLLPQGLTRFDRGRVLAAFAPVPLQDSAGDA